MLKKAFGFLMAGLIAAPAFAQVGIFDKTADWAKQGTNKVAGSAALTGSAYNVSGNGNDIWGGTDEGFFLYKEVTDSFQLTTKVAWEDLGQGTGSGEWAKAGIMVRQNGDDAQSPNYFLMVRGMNNGDQTILQNRGAKASDTDSSQLLDEAGQSLTNPDGIWYRLSYYKADRILTAEVSVDGTYWQTAFVSGCSYSLPFALGLAVTNHEDNEELAVTKFSDVTLTTPSALPAGVLSTQTVGDFNRGISLGRFITPGSASYDAAGKTYTLSGNGPDIWNRRDSFYYLYKEMTGNFQAELTPTVTSPGNADWTKAGLMVRKNLDWATSYGFTMVKTNGDFQTAGRTAAGQGAGDSPLVTFDKFNGKIKMVKIGNTVSGYYQDLNGAWILQGSKQVDIGLNDSFLLGLAVTSNDDLNLAEATFGNVTIKQIPFSVSSSVPDPTFLDGSTIPGVKVTVTPTSSSNAKVTQILPAGFTAKNIQTTNGTASVTGSTLVWQLANATAAVDLTYDLVAPTANSPFFADLSGTIEEGEWNLATGTFTLRHASGLGPQWVAGSDSGVWAVMDGVLRTYSDTGHDPKHMWVNRTMASGNYTVKSDARMVSWQDGDLPRAGISIRINPDDNGANVGSDRGINLLFHDDTNSIDILNDLVAWGPRTDMPWELNTWYTMALEGAGTTVYAYFLEKGTGDVLTDGYMAEWTDTALDTRSPGFPGLAASSQAGLEVQFDNFEVIENGKVVFSDNFDSVAGLSNWSVY